MKSGYCNISEPISDLDPARMSVIKARHSKKTKQPPKTKVMALESDTTTASLKPDENIASSNDDTFITETVTLETSPSNRSNNSKPVALSSMESRTYLSLSEKQPSSLSPEESRDAPNRAQDQDMDIPPPPMEDLLENSNRERGLELKKLKTPETFFRGKNSRKRISIRMDATSQAPTEHPMAAVTIGEGVDKSREFRVPRTKDLTDKDETQSQTSDLDKSFSPQIVSVNSDITDPSYGMSSSRRKRQQQQQSWKKFRKLRRYLHTSLNTKGNGNVQPKSPMSFLDMIMDALCSYPGSENGNKS